MERNSCRIVWIDTAKAILVSLMVLCHGGVTRGDGGIPDLVYSFHMPAFFIVSGYLFRPKSVRDRVVPLVLPVLFCSLLAFAWRLSFSRWVWHGELNPVESALGGLWSFVASGPLPRLSIHSFSLFTGFWFVFALVVSELLLSASTCRRHYEAVGMLAFLCMVASPFLPLPAPVFRIHFFKMIPALPFICLGIFLRERGFRPVLSWRRVLFLVACWLSFHFANGSIDMSEWNYGRFGYAACFGGAVSGSLLLFALCDLIPSTWIATKLSVGTLLVLGLHSPVLHSFLSVVRRRFAGGSTEPSLFLAIAATVPTLAVCLVAIAWAERKAPVLLGKRRRPKAVSAD